MLRAQRVARLFQRYGLGQNQAGSKPESVGHAGFAFHYGDGNRCLVLIGSVRAIEHLRGILRIVTVHDQQIEALCRQAFQRKSRLAGSARTDLELVEDRVTA